jgi:hypothetical protein
MKNYQSRFAQLLKDNEPKGFLANLGPYGTSLYEELNEILQSKSQRKRKLA